MSLRIAAIPLLALLATGCVEPDAGQETEPVPAETPLTGTAAVEARPAVSIDGEQLLADAPQGWRQTLSINRPGLRMAAYVPEGETQQEWSEKISFESLAGKPLPDPIEFVNGLSEDQAGTCEGFESFSTFSGEENGYPTTVHMLVCHRNKLMDVSQVTMIKAIQGEQYFYVVTRSKRGPVLDEEISPLISETEVAGWTLYLRAISACDPTAAAHPCP